MNTSKIISPYAFPGIPRKELPVKVGEYIKLFTDKKLNVVDEEFIMSTVESVTQIRRDDIIGERRNRNINDARRLYVYFVKEYLDRSVIHIGHSLNNRNHSVVSYYFRTYDELYKSDEKFKRKADMILRIIKAH
jgi:chromosomal replication initiation ATPase DnaA